MPMLPRITSLEPCDLPDFAALLRQDGRSPATFMNAHREHLNGERTILVARLDETVVGFVSVRHLPAIAEWPRAGTAEIEGLYVSIVQRGRGVGRSLIRAAEALAFTRGARYASLALPVRGDPAAQHLATLLGYEELEDAEPPRSWNSVRRWVKSLVPLPFPSAHSLAA